MNLFRELKRSLRGAEGQNIKEMESILMHLGVLSALIFSIVVGVLYSFTAEDFDVIDVRAALWYKGGEFRKWIVQKIDRDNPSFQWERDVPTVFQRQHNGQDDPQNGSTPYGLRFMLPNGKLDTKAVLLDSQCFIKYFARLHEDKGSCHDEAGQQIWETVAFHIIAPLVNVADARIFLAQRRGLMFSEFSEWIFTKGTAAAIFSFLAVIGKILIYMFMELTEAHHDERVSIEVSRRFGVAITLLLIFSIIAIVLSCELLEARAGIRSPGMAFFQEHRWGFTVWFLLVVYPLIIVLAINAYLSDCVMWQEDDLRKPKDHPDRKRHWMLNHIRRFPVWAIMALQFKHYHPDGPEAFKENRKRYLDARNQQERKDSDTHILQSLHKLQIANQELIGTIKDLIESGVDMSVKRDSSSTTRSSISQSTQASSTDLFADPMSVQGAEMMPPSVTESVEFMPLPGSDVLPPSGGDMVMPSTGDAIPVS